MTPTDASEPFVYQHSVRPEMHAFLPRDTRRILDVGCHTGMFGKMAKQNGVAEVWGVEPCVETAAMATQHLDRVFNGYFDSTLAIPDGYFDVVMFNDVLEHIPDPWQALALAAKKLAPGGRVIASIPNLRHIDNLLHLLVERDFRYEPEGIRDRTHLRFFTKKSIGRLFAEAGYDVQEITGTNEYWWTRSLWRRAAFRLFGRQLEDMKFIQFAVVARPLSLPLPLRSPDGTG